MGIINLENKFLFERYFKLGNTLFLLGVFFLPSALPMGGLVLLFSLIISLFINRKNLLQNIFDYIALFSIFIILIGTLYNTTFNQTYFSLSFDKSVIWLNLFNWIPMFLSYIGFQIYLKDSKQRLIFQKFLIAGTLPVIISCIMQKFFNMYGPFRTLFGTIVWFNYDPHNLKSVAGLFNNPNYLGIWLTLCFPFSISLLNLEKRYKNKLFLYLFNFLIIYFGIATNSRNALIGIFISLVCLLGFRKIVYILFFILLGIFCFDFLIPNALDFNHFHLVNKFSVLLDPTVENPRINIWEKVLFYISEKPFLGWGAGTLPFITMFTPPFQNYQHAHNIILEFAFNFGIPLTLLVSIAVFILFFKSFKKINAMKSFKQIHSINQAFLVSNLVFLIAHLTDITYYDGRISILFSILLASLIKIIEEHNVKEQEIYLKQS